MTQHSKSMSDGSWRWSTHRAVPSVIATLAFILLALPINAFAQSWSLDSLDSRSSSEGAIRMAVAVHSPASAPVRHVIVYPQPGSETTLKESSGTLALTFGGPWMRAAMQLSQQGIAVIYLDAPSDAAGRNLATRLTGDVRRDLQAGVNYAHKRFPGVPVHLGGFGTTANFLEAAAGVDEVSRVALISGAFSDARTLNLRSLKRPVVIVHAPTAQCDAAPYLEAELVAQRHQFSFVQAGYARPEAQASCGRDSQHALAGLYGDFAQLVADWFDGRDLPASIGFKTPVVAWREQVVTYVAPSSFGTNQLEMTLALPDGPGPFPLLVFNHGDIEIDHPSLRHQRRIRDMVVAREFLRLGMAVAMPSRRGVGMSEGTYPRNFSAVDGDPGYKARIHAPDITAALAYLVTRSEIDSNRIVLAGHSAGGYSALYLASTNPSGVIGAVDFSGGRTDSTAMSAAGYLNKMMVSGFAEFGRSIRVPTLFIFSENDSRYSVNTVRASYDAFIAAGGKARLSLSPPIQGDGHNVYLKPELWRDALREYLAEIGVPRNAR